MINKNNKYQIDAVAKHYLIQKRIIKEYELGLSFVSKERLDFARRSTKRINLIANDLDDSSRFIIRNEIILGKTGTWYQGFLSTPTYYRHRNKAYKLFLEFFEQ